MEKDMEPLFSVIIILYNSEKYIDQSVGSVLGQTFNDLELLLVNDGSIDQTASLCEKWATADNRIRVIEKENGGISDARNTGLANAKGKYVCFLDGDDWYDGRYLEKMSESVRPDLVCDCVLGNVSQYRESDGKICALRDQFGLEINGYLRGCVSGQDVLAKLIKEYGTLPMQWGARGAYRNFLLENQINFWDNTHEDGEFTMRVMLKAKVAKVNAEAIFIWRNRTDSTSKNFKYIWLQDNMVMLHKWISMVDQEQNKNTKKYVKREIGRRFAVMIIGAIMRLEENEISDFKRLLKENQSLFLYTNRWGHEKLRISIWMIGVSATVDLYRLIKKRKLRSV